jgi:hypothetical protein
MRHKFSSTLFEIVIAKRGDLSYSGLLLHHASYVIASPEGTQQSFTKQIAQTQSHFSVPSALAAFVANNYF